jgi:hypothetical protein
MSENATVEELKAWLESLEGCCLAHPQDYKREDVESVVNWDGSESADSEVYGIYKTKAGKFGVVKDYSDYTGHG